MRRMAPGDKKRLAGRKVVAVASFDSFAKMAMTLLAACRKEGARPPCICWRSRTGRCPAASGWRSGGSTRAFRLKKAAGTTSGD